MNRGHDGEIILAIIVCPYCRYENMCVPQYDRLAKGETQSIQCEQCGTALYIKAVLTENHKKRP